MAIFNREDSRTVLPQLEKIVDGIPSIQYGKIPQTSVPANSYVDVDVLFGSRMDAPVVVVGLVTNSSVGAFGSISAGVLRDSVTGKGFTCRIHNAGAYDRVPAVNWIALST